MNRVGRWSAPALLALAGAAGSLSAAPASVVTRGLLLDACRVGHAVVAVGERGNIVRTDDSGRSWEVLHTPSAATLTGVTFTDLQHGWAVGHLGTILATRDGGTTWSLQGETLGPDVSLLDVTTFDNRHVLAVGAYGAAFHSYDGGRTWHPVRLLEEDLHLNHLHVHSFEVFFAAGEAGTLRRIRDVRTPSEAVEVGYEGSFNGMIALPRALLVYGLRGHVYRSADEGRTWQPATGLDPVLLSAGVRLASGTVLVAGQARHFFISHDEGLTFRRWQTPLTWAVSALVEAPDGTVLAFGEGGVARLDPPPAPPADPATARPAEAEPTPDRPPSPP